VAAIRHQINIAVPVRTVWNALTTESGLVSWWADKARVDARPGGRIVLQRAGAEGETEERGIFHELRPTRRIEIAWDTNSPGPSRGTRVAFQVARDGDETRVALVHSGGGALDEDESRAALESEWKDRLNKLRAALEA